MNRRAGLIHRALVLATALGAAVWLGACSENLTGGKACPELCNEATIDVRDTIVDAVALDTSVVGFPPIGTENLLQLALQGDTLDARVILRYDTLAQTYRKVGSSSDSTIVAVDSARLNIRLDSALGKPKAAFTIEVFDVDEPGVDTTTAALVALMTPARSVGSKTFLPTDSLTDTLRVPISNAFVLDKITNGKHLRTGLRITTASSIDLRLTSTGTGVPTTLSFRATPDTNTAPIVVSPLSLTPKTPNFLTSALADYQIFAIGTPSPTSTQLAVGGGPGARTYIRFKIPARITDSSTIVRASLLLQQLPNSRSPNGMDSLTLSVIPVIASTEVTNIARALGFLGASIIDTARVLPAVGGERRFEIVSLVRSWKGLDTLRTPQALAILSVREAEKSAQVLFSRSNAGAAAAPRLQITFVPTVNLRLP
jgi:hypothetical protein